MAVENGLLKMYSLLKMGTFHCHVSLPEGKIFSQIHEQNQDYRRCVCSHVFALTPTTCGNLMCAFLDGWWLTTTIETNIYL